MKKVLIIGGGYAGVSALRELAKSEDIEVTLIDRHPYHFLQTEGYELVANTIPFDKTIVNLHTLCESFGENVSFLHDAVKEIDLTKKRVICEDSEELSYDYLIVAAGSVTKFFKSIEGLENCGHGVKSLTGAFKLKQFFEKELFLRLESPLSAKNHYSVLVAGAGLSGVEIAAQMQYYFNRYYKSNTLACKSLKIHLVSGSKNILKHMHPKTIRKARKRLVDLGVIMHEGSHIKKVEKERAVLENSEEIVFDFMIFTGGIMASPLIDTIKTQKNKLGQIIPRPTLQLQEKKEVFAAGDAAELRDITGNLLPPTAHVAMQSGKTAAKNIKLLLDDQEPAFAHMSQEGIAIALGGKYAILDMKSFRFSGYWAYLAKKTIEKVYKWPLWLKCATVSRNICKKL